MKFRVLFVSLTLVCCGVQAQFTTGGNTTPGQLFIGSVRLGNTSLNGDLLLDGKSNSSLKSRIAARYNYSLLPTYGGDLLINSYWGTAINIDGGFQSDTGGAPESVIARSSAFTVNTIKPGDTLANLFTIRKYGNVGIGIKEPKAKLDVNGEIFTNTRIKLGSNESSGDIIFIGKQSVPLATRLTESGTSSIQPVQAGDLMINNFWGVAVNLNQGRRGDGGNLAQNTVKSGTSSFTVNSFDSESSLKTLFTIRNGGNVGIGTTEPTEKLSVDGTVMAKKLKVTATGWADYVFEDDYKLPSLKETAAYIKANKHLPEIPTAKEVAENGQDVGEMNKLLLKKVEELTLHLIELQAKVEKLEAAQK